MDSYITAEVAAPKGAPLLLLLHGTGGNENDLIGLGRQLRPDAHLLAPRGDVSEHGALRFFKRTAEGVYDMADLARATAKLRAFVTQKRESMGFGEVFALGYSNGANIVATLLFEAPELIDRAVLIHPLIPFAPQIGPGIVGRQVLITAGRRDPISPVALTQRLADSLSAAGAKTQLVWHEGGHELRPNEVEAAAAFLK